MARRNKIREEQRELIGTKARYIGNGCVMTCEQCGHEQSKGMISLYEDKKFCSEDCVLASKEA